MERHYGVFRFMVRVCIIVMGQKVSRTFTLEKFCTVASNGANSTATRTLRGSARYPLNLHQAKEYNANSRSMDFLLSVLKPSIEYSTAQIAVQNPRDYPGHQ
jgi:hypothetical protein